MKVLISPSKTMQAAKTDDHNHPLFHKNKQVLLKYLQNMSLIKLKTYLSLSDALLQTNYERYQNFEEVHKAGLSYTGTQFKALDYKSLDRSSQAFLNDCLYIISGLYGLVRPNDTIGMYRLPMELTYNNQKLSNYWKKPIKDHLKDTRVINLASKEYSDALDKSLQVITIKFKGAHAMLAKKLRGLMTRYIALNKAETLESLKAFSAEGFFYNPEASTDGILVFSAKKRP